MSQTDLMCIKPPMQPGADPSLLEAAPHQHQQQHRWVLFGSFIVTGGVAASGSQAHLLCIFHAGVQERHTPRHSFCGALASGPLRRAGFPSHVSQAQVVPSGVRVGWVLHPGQKFGLQIGAWGTSILVTEFVRRLKSVCQSSQSSHQPGILMKRSCCSV